MELTSWENLAGYTPLLALVATAAVTDARARRIPNWLTFSVTLAGLAQSFTPWRVNTPSMAFGGLLLGFAVTFLLYILGGRGAGDVKLTAGIGAWVGPVGVILVLAAAALVSLAMAIVQCAASGRLTDLLRNSGVTLLALLNLRRLGARQAMEIGSAAPPSIARPMPNAVSLLLATAGVVLWVSRSGAG